jgi:hypothetical protein
MLNTPRFNRLFASDGKCFDVAIDHGMFGEVVHLEGIENIQTAVETVVAANPDAIQLAPGQARFLQQIAGKQKPSLVLRTDTSNVYGRSVPEVTYNHLIQEAVEQALVLGDDLLCTNPARIRRAVATQAADALLLKVNQIGTLSQAADAYRLARGAGWQVTTSARSGETEDHWLADLADGWGGDQIKVGSITQSERLAKYNRLLAIEAETGLPLVGWPAIGSS